MFVSVRASTIRAVTSESATGTTKKEKVRTMLTLTIEDIDYDTEACKLSLKGRNIEENPHVKMGAYHRLDLEMNRCDLFLSIYQRVSTFFAFDSCYLLLLVLGPNAIRLEFRLRNEVLCQANFSMIFGPSEANSLDVE